MSQVVFATTMRTATHLIRRSYMPLRPFGLPTFSVKSRFLVEMMIMEAAKSRPALTPLCSSGCAMYSSPGCTVQVRPKAGPDP